jgi:hypothetical protein
MAPPPGELWRAVVIDKARSVAGDAFMRKGHIERDWRKRESMVLRCRETSKRQIFLQKAHRTNRTAGGKPKESQLGGSTDS